MSSWASTASVSGGTLSGESLGESNVTLTSADSGVVLPDDLFAHRNVILLCLVLLMY